MSMGARVCPLRVVVPWWQWASVEGTGCSARWEQVVKEGARCQGLNGHKLFAEDLIMRQVPPGGLLGSP